MKRTLIALVLGFVLTIGVASPALAATGAEFGRHHADHAIAEGGFTGDHNPGMHMGYAGWDMQ